MFCISELAVTAIEQCDIYQFSHPFFPGQSCKEIYVWNSQTYLETHNRSEYYYLVNPIRNVYCEMEQLVECDYIGGWTRIASVDITRGDECPTGWIIAQCDNTSFCRSQNDNAGCYSALFSSNGILSYQRVCGMARGYQKGFPDGLPHDDDALFIHMVASYPSVINTFGHTKFNLLMDNVIAATQTIHLLVPIITVNLVLTHFHNSLLITCLTLYGLCCCC